MNTRIGLATALVLAASAAQAKPPCDQIAAFARHLPPKAWSAGDKALFPALIFDEFRSTYRDAKTLTPLEASLAGRDDVKAALGDDSGQSTVYIDRLAGTDLYALSSFQGTLHCQSMVFLEAPRGAEPRIVDRPPGDSGGEGEDCWTTVAGFGRAFGQPVWVVHDIVQAATTKASFAITPRTADGWGAPCSIDLTFKADYSLVARLCGGGAVCKAAGKMAHDVTLAYRRVRDSDNKDEVFTFGQPAPAGVAERVRDLQDDNAPLAFPDFGTSKGEARSFGGGGHILFPIQIGGRWYVGAVGQEGVGWREDENTLFAVYAQRGETLTPLAGFVIARSLAGLDKAAVDAPD
jgi:hypothetical protein